MEFSLPLQYFLFFLKAFVESSEAAMSSGKEDSLNITFFEYFMELLV